MYLRNFISALVMFAGLFIGQQVYSAMLSQAEVEEANLDLLQSETSVFQLIGMSITLSLAQCEGVELCTLNVDVEEMEELIKALDTRINTLTLKQEEAEDPAAFQQILANYVDTRDDYGAQLEKLKELKSELDADEGFLDDALTAPDFPVESARDAELLEYIEDLDLFEDEELEDDDDEWDLPPLPDDLSEPTETP